MVQLRQDYNKFIETLTSVVVLGPEGKVSFSRYFNKHDLPFIGIPDPSHSVLKLYGQQIKLFKGGRMPAQVLIDKAGIARFVHYGSSKRDIPTNEEMLTLIASL